MGATLSSQAEITSANPKEEGKIEFSTQNETLLKNVLRYVETLSNEHQQEAEVVFKQPFEWKTSITPADFEKQNFGEKAYKIR